jgi:hypothetical protein
MAQSNIIVREQAVYLGEETSFGVTPAGSFPNAMTRTIVAEPIVADGAVREMLDVNDVRVRRADAIQPVQGLELASKVALSMYLKATPQASQLVASATAAALTPRLFLRHALGTEYALAGSTVAAGTSSTQFDVQSGDGVLFTKGTFIAVAISGQMEWALVTNVATDTITVAPALSGTPATSAVVRNLYNYSMAESHAKSLAVQVAYVGDSAEQYTFNGAHGDLSFNFGEFGKLVTMKLDLTAVSFLGPSSQSIATTTASDEMGSAFPLAPQVYLAAASAPTRGTTTACEKFAIEQKCAWEMVRDPAATSTVTAVVDTAGRPRAAKAMLTLRTDTAFPTAFDAETRYSLTIVQRIGTGLTASFWIWNLNNVKLTAEPKVTKVGERKYYDLEWSALQDDAVTLGGSTGTALDAIYSPLRVAFG